MTNRRLNLVNMKVKILFNWISLLNDYSILFLCGFSKIYEECCNEKYWTAEGKQIFVSRHVLLTTIDSVIIDT
jgi:hypothetical protein